MRAFLWSETEVVQGGKCVVAWCRVQRPLHLGGLGIKDIKRLGLSLQMRWLWLQRTNPSRPRHDLPMKDNAMADAFFLASPKCIVGNGENALFWFDPWLDNRCIRNLVPDLWDSIPAHVRRRRMVAEGLDVNHWIQDIIGALMILVIVQYLQLCGLVDGVRLDPAMQDMLVWRWTTSGDYSASSAYAALFHGQTALGGAKELWKSRAPNKCRFFLWLALQDPY
jgi:hypothetical protein